MIITTRKKLVMLKQFILLINNHSLKRGSCRVERDKKKWETRYLIYEDDENFSFIFQNKRNKFFFTILYYKYFYIFYRLQFFKKIIFEQTLKRKEPKMLILKNIN